LEWYSKVGYNVIKEKMCCGVSDVVEGRHSFNPLCEVIDCDNDLFFSIARWWVTSHEVDAPFTKGAYSNDWVEKSRWFSCFVSIKPTLITSLHGMNAIVKQCRPKVTYADDFLSSGHPREMAPTRATMAVVQDSIGLVNS
jgi:hypothetical protein